MDTITLVNRVHDDAGRKIMAQGKEVVLPANTTVFRQGDACGNFLYVLEGSVKVYTRAENGREIVLYRVHSGQSCTLTTACLFSHNRYPAEGTTETEVKALVIPIKLFDEGLQHSIDFRNMVFDTYSQRLAEVITLVEELSFGRIDVRLAKRLCKAGADNLITATHQELATELGSAREVISRQLKEFENRGWVRLARGKVEILDRKPLEQLLSQAD